MFKKILEKPVTISVLLLVVAVGLFLNVLTLWTRDSGAPLAFAQSGGGAVAITGYGDGRVAVAHIFSDGSCSVFFYDSGGSRFNSNNC